MSKTKILFMGPYPTKSGYGAHSRDLIYCLLNSEEYDVSLIPTNWGNTPMNSLKEDNPLHRKIIEHTLKENLKEQPDVFMQVTIPNEFKPFGRTNIGITAGIETDRVSVEWIKSANNMNVVIVPSNHSRNVHCNSVYDIKQSDNGQVIGQIRNMVPFEVLFEGINTDIFKPYDATKLGKSECLKFLYDIPEEFAFLVVGSWLQGGFREDRKDISGTVYNFLNAFNYQKGKVALILKTSGANFSLLDYEAIKRNIENIKLMVPDKDMHPNIYVIHGDLTDEEMNELYNIPKIKAMFSCTHGEGFGRPLAEFSAATGKPILATNWSGHTDFMKEGDCLMFKYSMNPIPDSVVWNNILIKDSNWATVDDIDVVNKLKRVYYKYEEVIPGANRCQKKILENMTINKMQSQLYNIIDRYKPAVKSNIILPGNLDLSKLKKIK